MEDGGPPVVTLRPRWGQHVLRDPNMIAKMVRTVSPRKADRFIEIGAGTGAITQPLLEAGARVVAVERDPRLAEYLEQEFAARYRRLKVVRADALAWDPKTLLKPAKGKAPRTRFRLFGNLPYQITSPLLFRIISWRRMLSDVHITVQKEVAERLTAQPGSPAYGRLTLAVRFYAVAEQLFDLNRQVFVPVPGVDSSFLSLAFHKKQASAKAAAQYEDLIKHAFSKRRKTLANALASQQAFGLGKAEWVAVLERAGIVSSARAEELLVKDFLAIIEVAGGSPR